MCLAGRVLGLSFLLTGFSPLALSTEYRFEPDEWISEFLVDTNNDVTSPTISDNGRYVVFEGNRSVDSFTYGVTYVVDRQNPGFTPELIAQDCDDVAFSPCENQRPRVSGNGRYVVFDSRSSRTGGTFGSDYFEFDSDVFVWDRNTGTTTRVTVGIGGAEPDGESFAGDISRDGRYVVFESTADNLVAPPAGAGPFFGRPTRTYWKDLQTGTTKLVFDSQNLTTAMYARIAPRVTDNGRYVLARETDIQVNRMINWDALTGSRLYSAWDESPFLSPHNYVVTHDQRRISDVSCFDDFGCQAAMYRITGPNSAAYSFHLDVAIGSGDIGGIAISSGAGFLIASQCNEIGPSAFFHQIAIGVRGNTDNAFVYLGNRGNCFHAAQGIDITPDGRYIVVSAYDLAGRALSFGQDGDGKSDVFLVENPLWKPGPANFVSQFTSIPANSRNVKVSSDGSIGVFESEIPASEFGAYTDTNGKADVFRYLADFQQIELISTADGTAAFPGGAKNPAMSADGEVIVFEGADMGVTVKNLRPDGSLSKPTGSKTTTTQSIFLRSLIQNAPQRISTSRTGGMPNGNSFNPTVSPNGQWVGFSTDANNINPGSDANGFRDVLVIERGNGQRRCVTSCAGLVANGPSDRPSVSNNGKVAYESSAGSLQKAAGLEKTSFSFQILLRDLISNASQVISQSGAGVAGNANSGWPVISANGSAVAYQSGASNLDASGNDGRTNVFLHRTGLGSRRISRRDPGNTKTTVVIDGNSTRPTLSGDGRFVAFQTAASNLVDGDGNGVDDLMVFDSRGQALRRMADGFGGEEANGASETPHLNHNGQTVGFHSFASNLDAESDAGTASATSAPFKRENPLGAHIVFADPFE